MIEIELIRHSKAKPWTYADLDARQRVIAAQVQAGSRGGLLISELAPVITYGPRTPETDLLLQQDIPKYSTDRGGLATYHGPGQWVLFPVDRLERLVGDSRGVRQVVSTLLEVACSAIRTFNEDVEIREGKELGVWTPRGKIAAVGIHVSQGIVLHGLAVNGFKTETSFQGLRPCGLDAPVDFLFPEADEDSFVRLKDQLVTEFHKKLWITKESSNVA